MAAVLVSLKPPYDRNDRSRNDRCDHMETTLAIVAIIWKPGLTKEVNKNSFVRGHQYGGYDVKWIHSIRYTRQFSLQHNDDDCKILQVALQRGCHTFAIFFRNWQCAFLRISREWRTRSDWLFLTKLRCKLTCRATLRKVEDSSTFLATRNATFLLHCRLQKWVYVCCVAILDPRPSLLFCAKEKERALGSRLLHCKLLQKKLKNWPSFQGRFGGHFAVGDQFEVWIISGIQVLFWSKPYRNKDGWGWRRLRRIANGELEKIGQFFQDAPSVT